MSIIPENYKSLLSNTRAYRDTIVVAVSKKRSIEDINQAIDAGVTHIGESYLQEAKQKIPSLPSFITKHFIGQLQKNKIKDIVPLFDVIQSVDSVKKLELIEKNATKHQKNIDVCIQINISGESQKSGIDSHSLPILIEAVESFKYTKIKGLMAITLHTRDEDIIGKQMANLKSLFDQYAAQKYPNVDLKWLSMGMTNDYPIALKHGSNMIRVGRALFSS
jgi:hypothetical protein